MSDCDPTGEFPGESHLHIASGEGLSLSVHELANLLNSNLGLRHLVSTEMKLRLSL